MSFMPQRSTRSRVPLWVVLVAISAAGLWQYARSDHSSPAPKASVPEARTLPNRQPSVDERHDLSVDEARGGHTLARHVGRTDAELAERLRREPGINAASTYTDRVAAETTVKLALIQDEARIQSWISRRGSHPNLALDYRGRGDIVGRSLPRGARATIPCADALVVLRWTGADSYYVLTSYPEARR